MLSGKTMKKCRQMNNNNLMKMINQARQKMKRSKINRKKNLRWSLTKIIKVRVTINTRELSTSTRLVRSASLISKKVPSSTSRTRMSEI